MHVATISVVELARLRESSVKGHHGYRTAYVVGAEFTSETGTEPIGKRVYFTVIIWFVQCALHSNEPYKYNTLAKVATYQRN